MDLHKWCFNAREVMKSVDKNESCTFHPFETKTLCLLWGPEEGTFSFKLANFEKTKVTKRSVMFVIAVYTIC